MLQQQHKNVSADSSHTGGFMQRPVLQAQHDTTTYIIRKLCCMPHTLAR